MPLAALADTGLPPPAVHQTTDNGFPSSHALKQQGYNPQTGVLKVEPRKQGSPTITSNGQTVTGKQNVDVVVTDKYGNKVKVPSRITQTANAAVIASYIGGSVAQGIDKYGNQAVNDFRDGRYGDMGNSVAGGIATTLNGLSGGIFGSVGGVLDNAFGTNAFGGNPSATSDSLKRLGDAADNFHREMYGVPSGSSTSSGGVSTPSVNGGSTSSILGSAAKSAAAAQSAAEKRGDVGGVLGAAAVGKAADAAANAAADAKTKTSEMKERLDKGDKIWFVELEIAIAGKVEKKSVGVYTDKRPVEFGTGIHAMGIYNKNGELIRIVSGASSSLAQYVPKKINGANGHAIAFWGLMTTKNYESVIRSELSLKKEDMTLSADEITEILKRMFASQQTNHQEMMRQLSQIAANTAPNTSTSTESTPSSTTGSQVIRNSGSVVDAATTSSSVQGNTVTSAPYTPAGSTQAQQTQVTLNSDGTISTSIVPRPDLAAHSSQAPTRQEIPAPSQSQTNQTNQTSQTGQSQQTGQQGESTQTTSSGTQSQSAQNQQQRDFCQQNPSAAQCADLGNADYEDLDIPENAIDLKLEPLDIFSTDGTCPANPSVSFGALGELEIDYEYFCGVARMIRPILILGTIIMCGFFAYSAVKEV